MNAGKVSIWDAGSDLFMQPCVCQPGFWCSTKLWSDFQIAYCRGPLGGTHNSRRFDKECYSHNVGCSG